MADGVDHIDIYADVGEEFNQVCEGPGPRRRSGRRCGPDADRGPPRGASRRGCRPCALAARGPCRPTPARCPPRPSFYRIVSRVAGGAARRGAQSADAGRRAAAAGPSLAAASLPIVGGGRRALPAALGPGRRGRVCAAGRTGRRRAPSPAAGSRRKPGRRLVLGPAARAPIPPVAPFCFPVRARSPHGRPHSPPFVSRAPGFLGSPARVCDRFRCGAFLLFPSRFLTVASVWARLQQVL